MSGQFNDPLRVVAFNTAERWAQDVSKMWPSKSRAAAILMVATFRKRFKTLLISTPLPVGSLRCG